MVLRKINSVLSLITTVLLLDHAIINAVWFFTMKTLSKVAAPSWILLGFMAVHAMLSMALAMNAHNVPAPADAKSYPAKNVTTIIQRVTGMLLIVGTVFHVLGATGVMTPPAVVHAIVPTVFFIVCMAHTAISTSKAFITLGVGNAKVVKGIDIAVKVICAAVLVANIVGFFMNFAA